MLNLRIEGSMQTLTRLASPIYIGKRNYISSNWRWDIPTTFSQYLLTNEHELSIMGPGVLNKDNIAESFAHRLRTGLTIKAFGDGVRWYWCTRMAHQARSRVNTQLPFHRTSSADRWPPRHNLIPRYGKHGSFSCPIPHPSNLYFLWYKKVPILHPIPPR
jgi:hypothetical protein